MRPLQVLEAENDTVTGTTTVYTNSSGAGQAISLYDVSLSLSVVQNAAGVGFGRAKIVIDGVTVMTVSLTSGTNPSNSSIHKQLDCGGAQFFIANTHTVTLVTDGNLTACRAHCGLAADIQVGTA